MENQTEKTQAVPLCSGDLFGILTHAGNMNVGDDEDVCGLFVTCERPTLIAAKTLPMYRSVLVLPVEGYRAEVSRLQRVADLARDAVESGAVDECYLSLLRDAVSALANVKAQTRRTGDPK